MQSLPLFIISCERISKRQAYYLRFQYNEGLIANIKSLPEETRKWNAGMMVWEITTLSLFLLIKKYKGSNKIHFDFGNDDSRNIFIQQIKKLEIAEVEKRKFIAELNIKKEEWVRYKQTLEETYEKYIDVVQKNLKPNITLFKHQVVGIMFLNVVRNALLALGMGSGKAQPLDSNILTPNGYIKMGNIKIGDNVIGSDGKFKNVVGIFPQGKRSIFEVKFNDGSTVECCNEHIWSVNSPNRIHRTLKNIHKYPYQLKSLKQIIEEGIVDSAGNRKHFIPIVKPIEFEKQELKIDPYVLGCLLGDGSLTTKNSISFTSNDQEIVDFIQKKLPLKHIIKKLKTKYVYSIISIKMRKNYVNEELLKLNLKKHNSYTKFIPNIYKLGSINQRLELLQGILDTDGYPCKRGGIELTLASKQLIEDAQFIVQSLGGIGRLKEKWIKYKGIKRLYWKLNIKLPPQFEPFKLKRKLNSNIVCTKYYPNKAISEINYIGEKTAQCILIDSDDHLYCTDYCNLTHNTLISIGYVEMNDFKKVIVITPNSLKYNYLNEVKKFSNDSQVFIVGKKNTCNIENSKYIVFNYDYFNSSDFNKVKDKFDKLNIGKIDCLVADECHRISSTSTNTYKAFKRLFKDEIFNNGKVSKIFMSGTPAKSHAYQLYSVLHQISPLEFPTKDKFYKIYCGMSYNVDGFGWETDISLTKFEELFNKISPFTYRKKLEELVDLPEMTVQKIVLEMTPKEYETYYELEDGTINEFNDKKIIHPLAILSKLREYTSHLKTNSVRELIDSILECGDKLVIVDFFKKSLHELHDKYPEISKLHIGDASDTERAEIVRDFQDENGKTKLLLGSQSTISEGLTLTAANKIGIITVPWTPSDMSQIIFRIFRIGQHNAVNAYFFVYKDTIDEYVFDLCEKKRQELSMVIDGEKYKSDVNQSIINDLIEIIKNKHKK